MHEISLSAETLFSLGSFHFTNTMLVTLLISVLLIVFAIVFKRSVTSQSVISKKQNLFELIVEGAFSLMDSVTNNRKQSMKFFPLVMTLFLFILLANWSGLVPGVGPIGLHETHTEEAAVETVSEDAHSTSEETSEAASEEGAEEEGAFIPLFRAPSSDLNTTLALAIISLVSFQVFGIMAIGFFKYAGKFLNFKGPIEFFIGILEIIGELAKVISLSFRLFGNVFAGEVLLLVIAFLVPIIAPLPFFALEIFVGLIQAFIFAMLTLVFLKVASESAH